MAAEPAERRTRKHGLGINVLTAAEHRIAAVFDDFPRICVSFSGGKDSGVVLELAAREARRRRRRLGVLVVDLEAQYAHTIDYIHTMLDRHADVVDPYWVALPLNLRNAVSQFEPEWMCWDPGQQHRWVRTPPELAITDENYFDFFRRRMEFEEFVPAFADWFSRDGKQGSDPQLTACLVGIRSQESLNRWRTIASRRKRRYEGHQWTTFVSGAAFNAYPIYDWRTEDVWRYYGKSLTPYNALYDRMHQAGLTVHQARICQPYGDDQKVGLWLYHVIEPHTWAKVVARVQGANFGAAVAHTAGNVSGRIKVVKPDGITWEEYAHRLLASMPPDAEEHFRERIHHFLNWHLEQGNQILDDGPLDRKTPSWKRIVKVLLANDYWTKALTFSPPKSPDSYRRWRKIRQRQREEIGLI